MARAQGESDPQGVQTRTEPEMRGPQLPPSLPPALGALLHGEGVGSGFCWRENSPALTCERPGQSCRAAPSQEMALLLSCPPTEEAGAPQFSFSRQVKISAHRSVRAARSGGGLGQPLQGPGQSAQLPTSRGWAPLKAGEHLGRGPAPGSGCRLFFLSSQRLKARACPAPTAKTRNTGQRLQNSPRVPSAAKREAQREGEDAFLSYPGQRSRIHLISGILTILRSGRKEMAARGVQNEHPTICFCGL